MGDFLAPKRRDVVDRLRRRIEQYRCHHFRSATRFDASRPSLFEQHKQETQLLHQRWLESKAKKAAKQSKVKDSGGGGGGGTNSGTDRNLVNQKLKRKIDSSNSGENNTSATAEAVFKFDDSDSKPQGGNQGNAAPGNNNSSNASSSTNVGVSGGQAVDGTQQLPHLSVQIVQQISTQRQSPQTIHTNVTVSSTLQTRYPNPNNPHHPAPGSPAPGSNVNVHTSTSSQQQSHSTSVSASTTTTGNLGNANPNANSATPGGGSGAETSVHTSIECKQEPAEDVNCRDACNTSVGVPGIDIDELQDILDSIEKDDDIPQDLIKELDKFNAIYDKVQRDSENNAAAESSASMFSSLGGCGSPGLCKAAAPFSDPSGQQQHGGPPPALTPTMFETAQAMSGLPIRPAPALVEPTGPAAETLKQMAAQHQHQVSAAPPFSGKSMDHGHYPDPYDPYVRSRNGYPTAYPGQGFASAGAGTGAAGYPSYGQNAGYGDTSPQLGQFAGNKPDLAALAYGTTKPLTHYPGDGHGGPGAPGGHAGQPPSSLQQLQNQVASHFSPGPMHITQTQHVQLAPGAQRVQLSQTQQVQMAAAAAAQHQQPGAPPGMTLSQQQSFSMASHMQGQGQPCQTQAGMGMATARDMQFMQEKMRREQQQQQQQQQQQAQQQQQQYMNRPPPEYKMHAGARPSGPPYPGNPASGGNGGSTTPLQTMQNMVNQTPAYPGVKGEVAGAGGVMTQMSAVQSMAASVNSGGQHMGATMAQATQSMAYQQHQQQMPQRPPSYSPHANTTTPNGVVTTSNGGGQANSGSSGNLANSATYHSTSTSSSSQATSGYTSALLRNQRPPNVNVGPEGLNISQPRAHPGHPGHMGVSHPHSHAESWQRGAMMQGHMQNQMGRGPGMGGSPVTTMMPPGYAHRPGSAGSVGAGMGGSGPMPGAPGTHPMMAGGVGVGGSGAQVMMQQSVQMTQRGMSMRGGPGVGVAPGMGHPQQGLPTHSPQYNMVGPPGAMQTQSNGTPGPQYPGASSQDDFMHFLDQAHTPNFDSFDSMVSGSTSSDFNLFDEILSGTK
nr:hypothetical protein BaRGS_016828 [Batillaria attramentaria]